MKRPLREASARWFVALAIAAIPTMTLAQPEDSLDTARDFYAAAEYENALAVLDRLGAAGVRAEDSRAIGQYRAFCLLALGRSADAERAIEAVVTADPAYHPSDADVSPRVRARFSDVRRRMLPALVQQKYAYARAAFDDKAYAASAARFGEVLDLMADPDVAEAASRAPLSDLRTLTLGFRDLSFQSVAAVPPPLPAVVTARTPVMIMTPDPGVPNPSPAAVRTSIPGSAVFTSTDTDVVPPVAVRQSLPPFPGTLSKAIHGTMEIVVSESGAVESADIRVATNPGYDRLAVAAARSWRYKPATRNGIAVRYRKLVQVTLKPTGQN